MNLELFILLFTVSGGSAAVFVLPSNLMQKEGENLAVDCSVGPGETRLDFQLLVNGVEFAQTGRNVRSESTDRGTFFEYGPLRRSDNGATFVCTGQGMNSSASTLVVAWIDSITLSTSSVTATVGEDVVVDFSYSANPQPTISVEKAGSADSGVDQITNSEIALNAVTMRDEGEFTVGAANVAGSAQTKFNLIVMKDGEKLTVNIGGAVGGSFAGAVTLVVTVAFVGALFGLYKYCNQKHQDNVVKNNGS